jgi:hypothetical protein
MKRYDIIAIRAPKKHQVWFAILLGMTANRKAAHIQWLDKVPSPKGSKSTKVHYRITNEDDWILSSYIFSNIIDNFCLRYHFIMWN